MFSLVSVPWTLQAHSRLKPFAPAVPSAQNTSCQVASWVPPSPPLGLCSNLHSQWGPFWPALFKISAPHHWHPRSPSILNVVHCALYQLTHQIFYLLFASCDKKVTSKRAGSSSALLQWHQHLEQYLPLLNEWVNSKYISLTGKLNPRWFRTYGNGLKCSFLRVSFYFKYFKVTISLLPSPTMDGSSCVCIGSHASFSVIRGVFSNWQLWPRETFAWLSAGSAGRWSWNVKWPSLQRSSTHFPLSPHTHSSY